MPRRSLKELYRAEFSDYSLTTFRQDLFAGLTVAAVALPLALAFGVASGATPAAGMVTAILSGLVIGALSGSRFQISGPTGAMSAVLIVLVQRYGLEAVWISGLLSGILLLGIGLLRLGRFIAFIPAPVITGFTSGIALIIATGQLDNALGVRMPGSDSAVLRLWHYATVPFSPNFYALAICGMVVLLMALWPARWNGRFPGSLFGIIAATFVVESLKFDVTRIGEIPTTLLLEQRLDLSAIDLTILQQLLVPTISITALGAIESLLCGAVAGNMTGIRLQANQELKAQGIGNIIIPFFGGVPATAAIARSSVAIKSGGKTRMVSIIHALALLASMFLCAPIMSRIPLAALAGVLMVTAWRMNDWEEIHYFFRHRLTAACTTFLVTMIATFALDLTEAIIIGSVLSAAIFISQIAELSLEVQDVDEGRLRALHVEPQSAIRIKLVYISGPLFFAATGHFHETLDTLKNFDVLILSVRGVPMIDPSGLLALESLIDRLEHSNRRLLLAGVTPSVHEMLTRGGIVQRLGPDSFFQSSDQAIAAAALANSNEHSSY